MSSMIIEKQFNFVGIKVLENMLIPVEWNLELYMIGDETKIERTNIVFQKIIFWVETLLNGILAINSNDEFSLFLSDEAINPVMGFPGDPTEDIMLQMIFEKLKVLSEGCLLFEQIRLYSSDSDMTYTYRPESNDKTTLPDISYLESVETTNKEPWWKRPTSEINDFNSSEETDASVQDMTDISEDILITFEKELLKTMPTLDTKEKEATVIDIFDQKK